MAGTQWILDGLWKCLCPSFERLARRQAAQSFPIKRCTAPPRRHTPSVARFHQLLSVQPSRPEEADLRQASLKEQDDKMCQAEPPRKRAVHASVTVADLIRDQGKFNTLADAPNDVVLEALDELLLRQGQFNKARTFASHLLQSKFGINATGVYNALIATNWDPNGSADDVDATLRTMSEHKIEKTSQTYHNALWVGGALHLSLSNCHVLLTAVSGAREPSRLPVPEPRAGGDEKRMD